jgi:8-oxo-dGTP diphosphatase/2-hydroxy-dATP diphosphatase
MSKESFPERSPEEVQQATLCFLITTEAAGELKVCLAMKKRGFGEGLWNGLGGKILPGENDKLTVFRESFEEARVHLADARKVALLHFYFPDDPAKKDWNQDVHVYLADKWKGVPQETEEMKPQWFAIEDVPFDKMWADDPLWLPKVLAGGRLEAWFSFDENNNVLDYYLENVEKGGELS